MQDIARELILLYARRKDQEGFAFSADTYLQQELESSFIYEDTPDQLKATADVKAAQQQGIPNLYKDVERIKEGTEPSKSHTSGMPETIEHVDTGDKFNTTTGNIDEGNFSNFHTKVPERTKVTAEEDGMNYQSGDEFYADGAASKMKMKMHPAQQRMSNMVNKVAQYKMPNVKAAQKKYNK